MFSHGNLNSYIMYCIIFFLKKLRDAICEGEGQLHNLLLAGMVLPWRYCNSVNGSLDSGNNNKKEEIVSLIFQFFRRHEPPSDNNRNPF